MPARTVIFVFREVDTGSGPSCRGGIVPFNSRHIRPRGCVQAELLARVAIAEREPARVKWVPL